MHSATNHNSVVLVVMTVFAAVLLAAFAPAALARDDAADMAGAGIYENADDEAEFLRQRAEEFRRKASALQLQIRNDNTEAARLEAQEERLKARAKHLEAEAKQAETAGADEKADVLKVHAKRLEDSADNLDDRADDLRDSADDAEEEMEETAEQVENYEQLSGAIGNFAGQWECVYMSESVPTKTMKNNTRKIDFKPLARNGNVRVHYSISSNYGYARRSEAGYAFKAVREKKLDKSYEFQVELERSINVFFEGEWKIFRNEDGTQISFEKDEELVEINDIGVPETATQVLSPGWFSDNPVPGWENMPAIKNEAARLQEDANAVFLPIRKTKYEDTRPLTRSLSWWNKHCDK